MRRTLMCVWVCELYFVLYFVQRAMRNAQRPEKCAEWTRYRDLTALALARFDGPRVYDK